MVARPLMLRVDGEYTTFTDMRTAVRAFGQALNGPGLDIVLTEQLLTGEHVIAQVIRDVGQMDLTHARCPVCGVRHNGERAHGRETTGVRMLMQHQAGNHTQCHSMARCRGHAYTLAEIRNGTGFPKGARFRQEGGEE